MSDEYIRKQDAVGVIEKEMKSYVSDIWYKSATHSALNDVNENIKSLEPADVAPVAHGRWVKYTGMGKEQWMCSECSVEEKNPKIARYCYYCGAKMDAHGKE